MFEHLAGKVLGNILSKYFSEESLARNKSSTSAQLGVWSGYISLENLELKKDEINALLKRKGQPYEILHCSFRRVEITVPWSKLGLSSSKKSSSSSTSNGDGGEKADAVVVVVVDGMHVLTRTNFTFDDEALQDEAISQRRDALAQADAFGKVPESEDGGYSSWGSGYAETIKKRITEGVLQQIIDKLHIHVRDLHIRLEDTESDPENPFACGVTMESMHVQHSTHDTQVQFHHVGTHANTTTTNGETRDGNYEPSSPRDDSVIQKVAQVNHFAIYMNALGYGQGVPAEHAILQDVYRDSPSRLLRALDLCIARRASVMASPSKNLYIPTHSYLLLPVDSTMNLSLSTNPKKLEDQPALLVDMSIDDLSVQFRDFQPLQLIRLVSMIQNHSFTKKCRLHRPDVSVKDNSRLWWQYASRAILLQLKEHHLRWSWSRFHKRLQLRDRYIALYERMLRFQSKEQAERKTRTNAARRRSKMSESQSTTLLSKTTSPGGEMIEELEVVNATPDEGAGPSVHIVEKRTAELSLSELNELRDMEDGVYGDLSIHDIIMFRAVANMRLGRYGNNRTNASKKVLTSWWKRTVENAAVDDSDAKEEFERLLSFLYTAEDSADTATADVYSANKKSQLAISVAFNLKQGCVAFFAPLSSTSDQTQLRRLHERFLELVVSDIRFGFSLMGDYESSTIQVSMQDFRATEIRADRGRHVVAKRANTNGDRAADLPNNGSDADDEGEIDDKALLRDPLLVLCLMRNSPKNEECDEEFVVFLDVIDIFLVPECQWIARIKQIGQNISKLPKFSEFWGDLAMAYVNSIASGRLGFLAKAETAGFKHKNSDLDVTVQCPVLHISDVNGCCFEIDLGIAHLKTEKLAGVASTKLGDQTLREYPSMIERHSTSGNNLGSIEEAYSITTPPQQQSQFNLEGGSTSMPSFDRGGIQPSWSVDSRSHYRRAAKSIAGSAAFDDQMTFKGFDPSNPANQISDRGAIHALFYDIYRFQLMTGKITIESLGEGTSYEVTSGFEVKTIIQKSVIPADHTLCRLKAHSVVSDVSVVLSESVILYAGHLVETWKSVLKRDPPSPVWNPRYTSSVSSLVEIRRTPSSTFPSADPFDDDSLSQVNENEFFDAHDGNDSLTADHSGQWFDDNWIADAESVIDSRAPPPDRRGRPRQPSISDVSSASDQSLGRRRNPNAYLSAENLARLEEKAGEDESAGESLADIDNDNNSFHSALSAGGQALLAQELEEDILMAEEKVSQLSQTMKETAKTSLNSLSTSLEETKQRRTSRKLLKLELDRSVAELNAMRALNFDLRSQISVARENGDRSGFGDGESTRSVSLVADASMSVTRARTLLNARKKLDASFVGHNGLHSLTSDLNRQLFSGSILFNNLKVTLILRETEEESAGGAELKVFEVCTSQTGLALFQSANDTKIYFSIDHITAALKGNDFTDVSSLFPFLGGSNNPAAAIQLPHHLPDYIASSMEERFLRGAFHQRRRRHFAGMDSPGETNKLRIVFGDVELTPHQQCLTTLISFCSQIRERYSESINGLGAVNEATNDKIATSTVSQTRLVGAGIARPSDSSRISARPTKCYDIAIRLASIRVALCHDNQIVGAFAIAETSLRFTHVESLSIFKSRSQIDFRCANFQVLSIRDLRAGKGIEALGRSDPYGHLINIRVRRQLVPLSEQGGWAVGSERSRPKEDMGATAWNVHVGVRINPVTVVVTPLDLSRINNSLRELKGLFPRRRNDDLKPSQEVPVETSSLDQAEQPITSVPLRWRVDLFLRKASLIVAGQRSLDDNDIGMKLLLSWSMFGCMEQSVERRGYNSVRIGLVDLALSRHSDDWPVLEQFSILSELVVATKTAQRNCSLKKPTLKLPVNSPWNELAVLMHRHGWDALPETPFKEVETSLALKITPVRANLSAPLCVFLKKTLDPFQDVAGVSKLSGVSGDVSTTPKVSPVPGNIQVGVQVSLTSVEARVLRVGDNRPLSFAEPLVSFTLTDALMAFELGAEVSSASVFIRKAELYDLSLHPAVRVVGEDPGVDHGDQSCFLKIKINLFRPENGPKAMRLYINWGRIQCLVLPSLIRSLLTFRDEIKLLLGPNARENDSNEKDPGALSKILGIREDLILSVSAAAESFECILSSKDIAAYLREKSPDPIGVVAFRWNAVLDITFGLDSLLDVSDPWSTLNSNNEFTDTDDVHLFNEFSNRYLNQSSGFLAGADEVELRLINAFTAQVNLCVTGFQAIRTYISSPLMDSSLLIRADSRLEPRIFFEVAPPFAGESRITNSIDLKIKHRLAGASMSFVNAMAPRIEISQLIELDAKFIDVLAYISQSATGVTEAFRVTVKPIVDMFKRKEESEPRNPALGLENSASFTDLFERASTICSVQIEGFQVTCVPGGATRLTESPIIKFELTQFSIGFSAVPVPKEVKLMTDTNYDKMGVSQPLLSGVDVMHLTLAGWLNCNVSADYHNRRLVAWEPFIEPWVADVRFGLDLVDVLHIKPFVKADPAQPSRESMRSAYDVIWSRGRIKERAGDTFRDIGRLWPFKSISGAKTSENGSLPGDFVSHPDFCYLMLASAARSSISLVLYPSDEPVLEKKARVYSHFPGHAPIEWLSSFGYPQATSRNGRESASEHSVTCIVSDTKPLNVNITGALIENVLGYLDKSNLATVAPHWIRNDSGMTIRFQEVLDVDRATRGEAAGKVMVLNGSEVPLTLKRSVSQSCDPHRAYLLLELGSFEDTVGRVNHDEFDIPKGSRSSTFFFKAVAKIPVDTVGVYRYPLDRNVEKQTEFQSQGTDSRALGWIIVRIALKGGMKLVSVESPFVLKSNADACLLCEVRDHNGLSLLWRCLIPKADWPGAPMSNRGLVSVPVDIVPFIHDESYVFSVTALSRESSLTHEAELVSVSRDESAQVPTPPPFSPSSFSRGLIGETEIALTPFSPYPSGNLEHNYGRSDKVHLNVANVRIGSFSGVKPTVDIPEQRMIFFRSPLVIRNYLALPILIQVRAKIAVGAAKVVDSTTAPNSQIPKDASTSRQPTSAAGWEDIGVLDCGQSVNWTGAFPTDKVELRVRFAGTDGEVSNRFPSWSTPITIPVNEKKARGKNSSTNSGAKAFAQMKIYDASNGSLPLSVSLLEGNDSDHKLSTHDSIRQYSHSFPLASRVVSIHVPFWIVDSTGEDLEFFSGSLIAGQAGDTISDFNRGVPQRKNHATMGLAELLDDDKLMHLPSRSKFTVVMIGEDKSTRLNIRKRKARPRANALLRESASPWSEPIPLRSDRTTQFDVTVFSAKEASVSGDTVDDRDRVGSHRRAFRTSIVPAPERFGGNLGTRLIHVVNRFAVLNEMGRDIEIKAEYGSSPPELVRASSIPRPFHFDDSSPIRFRFKEFGWNWSGRFSIRANQRETTLRHRHKMKGDTVIATVEFHTRKNAATSLIVFRLASRPPFRLENHTMYPLHFGQSTSLLGTEDAALDSMLLPYQNADFAWDEPELRRRALIVQAAGSADMPNSVDSILGRFFLDRIAPGTELLLDSKVFSGEVVADGPTRVLRISDASMPRLPSFRQDERNDFYQKPESSSLSISLSARLIHGIGISIVDWSPQELLYARLDHIHVERNIDQNKERGTATIGNIRVNNQLWVTPYPVFLNMGKQWDNQGGRRRNRRHNAVSLTWDRSVNTHGGSGNLTLLERVDVSSEPVFVSADGYLARLLARMARQISGTAVDETLSSTPPPRDQELRSVLGIKADVHTTELTSLSNMELTAFAWGLNSDFMVTAALAAKLRVHPPLRRSDAEENNASALQSKEKANSLSTPQHKYYIEKLRISAAKAELSWSGPLPGAFSSLLLRALTFEGLPLRLRPVSSSHAYGTAEDHIQSLKSHYLSFWRLFDLLIGLSFNPTFMIRAVVYTCRQSLASMLDSWSETFRQGSDRLLSWMPNEKRLSPTYDDGLPVQQSLPRLFFVKKSVLGPFVSLTSSVLRGSAMANAWGSTLLRYGPQSTAGANRSLGLVRSRNPRLFANVDGKDLLVEYVEGENAGKALLSRVRMGMHLGEGYIFHTEGARQRKIRAKSPTDVDSAPLILMVTSERVLLLDGKLDQNFCTVLWESMFEHVVHLEVTPADLVSTYEMVIIWYLADTGLVAGYADDRKARLAKSVVSHAGAGTDVLRSEVVFIPRETGVHFLAKVGGVDKRITDRIF